MPTRNSSQDIEDMPTVSHYIPTVIDKEDCTIHDVPIGKPCFTYLSVTDDKVYEAICNYRAKRAGMTHPIRPASLDRSFTKNPRMS